MKRTLLFLLIIIINTPLAFCQTAVDFTANDCYGTSHHLFGDLDAGKIVVISFVMPCGSCIGPSQAANSVVQGYASSNPGKVVFYISDDIGNTPCSTLASWVNSNGLAGITCFSDTSIHETDYGTTAMPKIVALAGADHQVIFKQDNTLNTTNLQNAINTALNSTSVPQALAQNTGFSLYPNPAQNRISLSYTLDGVADVSIDIINTIGKKVKTVIVQNNTPGQHTISIELNEALPNGIYFAKLNTGKNSQSIRFTINK